MLVKYSKNLNIQNRNMYKSFETGLKSFFKLNFYRIDIVESEFGKMHRSRRNNKTGRRLLIDTDTSPEFLCEKVYVQVNLHSNTAIRTMAKDTFCFLQILINCELRISITWTV